MDYYDLMLRFTRLPLLLALALALTANAQTSSSKAPPSALDGQLFYQLLLGELKARDNEPGTAYSLMLDAARKTQSAQLYQRAVEIALQARSGESALMAARAWRQALPESREANSFVLQILMGLNRVGETLEPLKRELASAPPQERPTAIATIPRFYARATDKKLAATTVEQALAPYLKTPLEAVAAWTVIGRMRWDAGDVPGALEAARQGQALDASAEGPALLGLQMMGAKSPQAETLVTQYLQSNPKPDMRMAYARTLLGAQRYDDAQSQLSTLTTEQPDYPDAWLIRGILALQGQQLPEAETSLKRFVTLARARPTDSAPSDLDRGLTQAYLSLAQIAEQRKDMAAADDWLKQVSHPDDVLNAQLRRAVLMARQGELDAARLLIRSQPERSVADTRLKVSAEVQILRDQKQYALAYELLTDAVTRNPSDLDFFYDLAMVVEKMGNLPEMERLLRSIIDANPQYHQAYNALGYSLAERGIRLPEAKQLILKALEFAKDDPYITDSLGWVEFRSGHLAEAAQILQGAYAGRPDAEIAAHLGEVLWAMGQRDDALRIWKEGLQLNPDNETLQETLKRLHVTW